MKQQINFRASDMTNRQLTKLVEHTGLNQTEVIALAIDRMYQKEIKMYTITIRFDDDSLFGNLGFPESASISKEHSARRYGELAEAAVRKAYPTAEIEVEYGPTMRTDEVCVNGMPDDDETENVQAITSKVYQSFEWVAMEGHGPRTISINNGLSTCTPEEALAAMPWDVIVNAMDDEIREQVHNEGDYESDLQFLKAYLEYAPIVIG